ncbi:MAG: nucleotide pyrophosphohydrolase [bacterium]|nr:nucleotide pyrophosphohydrolase [bacterium]
MSTRTIALPRLNRLEPTLEATALKLMEEAGELAKTILSLAGEGKQGPALSRAALDLLDVAQTAITMMYVLEEQYGVDVSGALDRHLAKLLDKGYLSLEAD